MERGLFSCAHNFRFSLPIPLPASCEPPEAQGELPNTGIAIPRELFNGRASCGVADGNAGKNSPFPSEAGTRFAQSTWLSMIDNPPFAR